MSEERLNHVKQFCKEVYLDAFSQLMIALEGDRSDAAIEGLPEKKQKEYEAIAQKYAIKHSIIAGLRHFSDVEPSIMWKSIYEAHVHRKSGVDDAQTINAVISADQSWKKSSGHAFEEMIKDVASEELRTEGISLVLQRDLTQMLSEGTLSNEERDLIWLAARVKESVFDLYAIVEAGENKFCFGCIQCKTSIRDRVTRDREPSIDAMRSFFWSAAIVLDGSFLKMPKFISMVNGGGTEHQCNGWHGLYVFTEEEEIGRIHRTDIALTKFKDHAKLAARQWLTQRQWFNETWNPENN